MAYPAGAEVFANQPLGTVTAGGTTTSDTAFTVNVTNPFPTASAAVSPSNWFRIVDPALPTEVMVVTAGSGAAGSQSWTVTRGAEGTTAVAHAANWTCRQLISAGTLQTMKQSTAAAVTPVTLASSITETVIASYQPVVTPGAGDSWEAIAYGSWGKALGVALPTLTWRLRWGGVAGTVLATLVTGTSAPPFLTTVAASGLTFDVNGTVSLISPTSAVANLNWWFMNAVSVTAGTAPTAAVVATGPTTIAGTGPLVLTAQWSVSNGSNTLTAMAPLIYKAA